MTNLAKKIVELQRQIQQSFLNIEEHNNPKTLLSRKRAGTSADLQLSRSIETLTNEVAEVAKAKDSEIGVDQMDVFSSELALLEQSSARLNAILRLMNVTKSLRQMKAGKDASLLIKQSQKEFDEMRERYPFNKDDIEARVAHIIFTLFIAEATNLEKFSSPISDNEPPLKRQPKMSTKIDRLCSEMEAKARQIIDTPNPSLHVTGEIEQHNMFSTEKVLMDLVQAQKTDRNPTDTKSRHIAAGPHEWLASLKLEKCKVSIRARNLLKCLTELIDAAAKYPKNHNIARSVASIIQLFTIRAPPTEHSGVDAAIFFNDCLYLAIEFERAKCNTTCNAANEKPTDAFNFSSLLAVMRKTGRNTLIQNVAYVKKQYMTWSENALDKYMKHKSNEFSKVLTQLKRFSGLWYDVCSMNTYAWLMCLVCVHILNLLVNTLLKNPKFDRATCSKILPVFSEVVNACNTHIRKCESDLKKKFTELKPGQALLEKVNRFKEEIINRGADQSLSELFDFKLIA